MFSFPTTSSILLSMIWGFCSEAAACASAVRNSPSQPIRKLSVELKTVGVLSERGDPSGAASRAFLLAPLVPMSWQLVHLRVLPRDSRGSPKRRSPRATLSGFAPRGSGTGVIGSTAEVLYDPDTC